MNVRGIALGILASLTGFQLLLLSISRSTAQIDVVKLSDRAKSAISRDTGIPVNALTSKMRQVMLIQEFSDSKSKINPEIFTVYRLTLVATR